MASLQLKFGILTQLQCNTSNPTSSNIQTLRTVSNYIESENGQEFSVKCTVKCPPYKMDSSKLCFFVYVDGYLGWILICERAPFYRQGQTEWEDEAGGVKEGKGQGCQEYGFQFAKIETSTLPFRISLSQSCPGSYAFLFRNWGPVRM